MARSGNRWRVEVLGPIRVFDVDGRDVTPEGVLQRRLLALLVLCRDRTTSVDVAIEVLWPRQPPRDPVAALHNQVFRLRRRLSDDMIESTGHGYRLASSRIDLDADRLAQRLATGGDAGSDVVVAIDATLERWQGPAYPELDDVDEARLESTRLDDLRVRALEDRAERRLGSGDTDGSIADLAALVETEPLRERPRALLMAALAQAGRLVEALRAYDDFRRLLGDELGIEPSPSLAAQHADLLVGSGAAAARGPTTRLPIPATSLIGRDDLAAEVMAIVAAHRVVTLVGPGGVGKTRLVVEVGYRLQVERPERPVVLCELAGADGGSALDVVAAALRIDARSGIGLTERIASVLGDSGTVLVLDNCEHVLHPVAALVEHLVASCPNVQVVTTSRERLRVPGERVRAVPPLSWGDDAAPAVQLLVERARAVAPGFEPDERELAVVADIVRRLDGLPLAIELAAARLHTHDVDEVAAGLDRRFSLLSSGSRTSTRHGSLGAAVGWSYELLDERLQQVFADLSVFAGSFTDADAATVCAADPAATTAALAQLIERSLVKRAPDRRYVLLETLRAFGAEQLDAAGRAELAGDRHAQYQVAWVERADRLLAEDGDGAITAIDVALPELRAALGWLLDHDQVELAGRLVVALLDYGFLRQRPDVLAWAQRVTDADVADESPMAALVWVVAAYAAWMAGDSAETGHRSRRALRASQQAGGPIPARVANICGNCELFEGHLSDAARWYRRAADAALDDPGQRAFFLSTELLARSYAGDPEAEALANGLLADVGEAVTPHAAYIWYCAGEAALTTGIERAHARLTHAISLAERTGATLVKGLAGASRASLDARHGDPIAAAQEYRQLIAHWRRAGVWSTQWTMLRSIALLLERLERPLDAAVLVGAVRATTAGHRIFGADEIALTDLAARLRTALGEEDFEAARRAGAVLDGDAAVEHALRAL